MWLRHELPKNRVFTMNFPQYWLKYPFKQERAHTEYRQGYPHTCLINHCYWHALLDQWDRQVRSVSPEIGRFPSLPRLPANNQLTSSVRPIKLWGNFSPGMHTPPYFLLSSQSQFALQDQKCFRCGFDLLSKLLFITVAEWHLSAG